MDYLELTVATSGSGIDTVAACLTAGGFDDLVIEDQQEFESFLADNRQYWDYIDETLQEKLEGLSQIKLYLEQSDKAGFARLEALLEQLKDKYGESLGPLTLTVQPLAQTRLPVILDPGLTFGTGAHPSTQMVMEFMEQLPLAGKNCLDLGSGSGILSITALRLGAKTAVGVDIDPKAENIARENAAYNGYGAPEFTALTGNVTGD